MAKRSNNQGPKRGHREQATDLTTDDDPRPLVEPPHQRADQPRLALASLAEQHDVVAREDGALHFR